jgi:ketosteroid isomerase-like protein
MNNQLPKVIKDYFAAVSAHDFDAVAGYFTENGFVHDEKHNYTGRKEIRAWIENAAKKYQYSAEILDGRQKDNTVTVQARLTGNFPGSPVEVEYKFTLEGTKIFTLDIT